MIFFGKQLKEAITEVGIDAGCLHMDEAREQILYGLKHCHILKISDNEIQWQTGKSDYSEGAAWINERYKIPFILVSMGKQSIL